MSHPSKTLRNGDRAPAFTLLTQRDEPCSLESLVAQGPVLLAFHRGTW